MFKNLFRKIMHSIEEPNGSMATAIGIQAVTGGGRGVPMITIPPIEGVWSNQGIKNPVVTDNGSKDILPLFSVIAEIKRGMSTIKIDAAALAETCQVAS